MKMTSKEIYLILLLVSSSVLIRAQNNISYFKGLKNVVQLEKCSSQNELSKNLSIQCLDSSLERNFNSFFNRINKYDFELEESDSYDKFTLLCELKYTDEGYYDGFVHLPFDDKNIMKVELYVSQIDSLILLLDHHFKKQYKTVTPAINYEDQNVETVILIKIGVLVKGSDMLFKYYNIPNSNLIDYNNYSNQKEITEFYNYMYGLIEEDIDTGFKKRAQKNGIERCYAHILFEVDTNGRIVESRNVEVGNPILEKFLLRSLKTNRKDIRDNYVNSILLNGEAVEKRYFMSFKYGYN